MDLFFPQPLVAVCVGVVLGLLAIWCVVVAARRTVKQPLALAMSDESVFLTGILAQLGRLPYVLAIEVDDFAVGSHRRIWSAVLEAAGEDISQLSEDPTDAECARAGEALEDRAEEFHAQVHRVLAQGEMAAVDLARVAYLSQESAQSAPDDDAVLDAGQVVLVAGNSRNVLRGRGKIVPSSSPDSLKMDTPPLRRLFVVPSRLRRVVGALLAGVAGVLIPAFVTQAGFVGAGFWLAVASLGVLVLGALVLSLVDIDTLYIDLKAFLVTSGLAWGLTIAAVGVAGEWGRLLVGVVVVACVAVLFEVVNRVYRAVRGVDGQGFGDTLLVLATVGVPAALANDWILGYYAVMAGFVAALVGWAVGKAAGSGADARSPIAFGPYLAAGWVVGWIGYLIWL